MKLCLCKTDSLMYKSFINGNEYQYEYEESVDSYKVYNEIGEWSWFILEELKHWFVVY